MDTVILRQFLSFFQDFIDLCQWKEWPTNDTTEEEIRNAFVKSAHIETCLDRFIKNKTLDDFLTVLSSTQDSTDFFKACIGDPTKSILKKVIAANTKIDHMDVAFKIFLQLFSEKKLETCLTDLILEASSKETLLKHLHTEIPRGKILKFKSEVFLSQISADSVENLQEILKDYNKDIVEIIVVSLGSSDPLYQASINILSQCLLDIILSKSNHYKKFWKLLFNVEDEYLIKMCVENSDLYTYMCEALIDCGKVVKENISAEYFYIEFSHLELVSITKRLFSNEFLKAQFFNIINNHGSDLEFWQHL